MAAVPEGLVLDSAADLVEGGGSAAARRGVNTRDFPPESTNPHGIDVLHPDDFLLDLHDLYPIRVQAVLSESTAASKPGSDPPPTLRITTPRPASTRMCVVPALTRVEGPARFGSGRGDPVPVNTMSTESVHLWAGAM